MFDQKRKPLMPTTAPTVSMPKTPTFQVPNKTGTTDEIDAALRAADELKQMEDDGPPGGDSEEERKAEFYEALKAVCGCW